MLLQASKLDLLPFKTPPHSSSVPSSVSAVIYEPSTCSLALMLSDSSLLLYPSFSPSPSLRPTPVPPVSTAFAFLRLSTSPTAAAPGRVILLSAAPHAAGSALLLRAWALSLAADRFAPARLSFKRDRGKPAVNLDLRHGLSVQLAGSVNVLVLHSLAAGQIWVMAAREAGEDGGVELVKCAVVECTLPIYSVRVSMGLLLLGEVGGVRVFLLRPLIKGKTRKHRGLGQRRTGAVQSGDLALCSCKKSLPNGLVSSVLPAGASARPSGAGVGCCNGGKVGCLEGAVEGTVDGDCGHCKLKTLKLKQTSGDLGSFFVLIRSKDFHHSENRTGALASRKAVSIHLLPQKKFLILDSVGDLHLLNLHSTVISTEAPDTPFRTSENARMYHVDHDMKVQLLAVLPDISARSQVVWMSDGGHSVHMVSLSDIDPPSNENEHEEKAMQVSAIQTIFTSEKILDVVPLAASTILVLGQGNIFTYAVA